MSEMLNEILVVEVEFPLTRFAELNEDQLKEMRAKFIRNRIMRASSITLTGVITDVGPDGYEKKDVRIKI